MGIPNACCCGSATCDIGSSERIADFTQVSGTWTETGPDGFGDYYIETSSANGIILFSTPHPESLTTGRVLLAIDVFPTTGTVRLLLAYQDADNYIFCELELDAGDPTIFVDVISRLGYREAGVDHFLESSSGRHDGTNWSLCYNGSRVSTSGGHLPPDNVIPNLVSGMDSPLTVTLGTYVGFQVIGITGTASFSMMSFHGINDISCVTCPTACVHCTDLTGTPSEYSLYLTGVANDNCGTCVADYDGATIILPAFSIDGDSTRTCYFRKTGVDCNTFANTHDLRLHLDQLRMIGDEGIFNFTRTANLCTETLTKVGGTNNAPPAFQQCDWSGATAELTPNMA